MPNMRPINRPQELDKVQAAIFDMDGLLIDSEPLWQQAEQQVFSSLGAKVSPELAAKTAAMTTRDVTRFWYRHFPWRGTSLEQVELAVIDRVEALMIETGTAMDGVVEVLQWCQKQQFKIGLSTNSPARLIPVVLNKLGIADYFHAVSSAEHEAQGKPHPAVYLSTAKKLKVAPEHCIAFEDSYSGLLAAKKANMQTVVVPASAEFMDEKFALSGLKLRSLLAFEGACLA